MECFHGSKIALLIDGCLVTYKRDNIPSIPFPNLWDLPGGGRQGSETPEECAARELCEEFNIRLQPFRFFYKRRYPDINSRAKGSYFLAALITQDELDSIEFGTEGQSWELMTYDQFLENPKAVPHLKLRLKELLVSGVVEDVLSRHNDS